MICHILDEAMRHHCSMSCGKGSKRKLPGSKERGQAKPCRRTILGDPISKRHLGRYAKRGTLTVKIHGGKKPALLRRQSGCAAALCARRVGRSGVSGPAVQLTAGLQRAVRGKGWQPVQLADSRVRGYLGV